MPKGVSITSYFGANLAELLADKIINLYPDPVFEILEMLKEDPIKFVQKSVANHLTDYLKVNYEPTAELIRRWRTSDHPATRWIVKHATRKIEV